MIKRKLLPLFIVLVLAFSLALPVMASDVSAAKFKGNLIITNSSASPKTFIATIFTANTSSMLTSGFLGASIDLVVQASGSDMAVMPAPPGSSTSVVYVPSISGYGSQTDILYTKGATGGKMCYFNGTTGMAITDSASMEPSNNFTDTKKVLLSTAGTVVRKNVTYYEYWDGTTYYVDDYETHIISTAETEEGVATVNHVITMPATITAGNLLLIFFTASGSGGINTPAGWTLGATDPNGLLYIFYKIATGGDTVTITTVNPMGASAIAYNIIGAGTPEFGTAASGASANPDPPAKTVTTTPFAHIWIAAEGNDTARTVNSYPAGYGGGINATTAGSCTGTSHVETYALSANPGTYTLSGSGNWGANTVMVPITSIAATSEMSAAVSAGERIISVSSSAASSSLTVDSVEVDTGVSLSISNTTSDWQICSAGTLYLEYYRHYVGGNLKCYIMWQYTATTFTDLSGSGNNATPTYRTTSSDASVTASLSSFGPITESKAPAFAVGAGPDFISDNITATETPNPVSSNNVINYPMKGVIDAIATAGGVPYQIPSMFIGTFVLLALSILTSIFLKNNASMSIMVKSTVNIAGYGVLVSLHIFDWWMLIFFFLFEQAVWFAAKERGQGV